jgi:hypothetical protein
VWVALFSSVECIKYHFLASEHIAEYMLGCNLHRFSQQGWENFKCLLKAFFFHRTAHGGPVGGKGGDKSKLIPVAGCCNVEYFGFAL